MMMFALGFLACYLLLTVAAWVCDKTDRDLGWILTEIICYPLIPIVWLACWPIWFFKNLSGVTQERFDWCKKNWPEMKAHHLLGPVWLMHDPKASKIFKHWFLVRVKKEATK